MIITDFAILNGRFYKVNFFTKNIRIFVLMIIFRALGTN